MVSAMQSSRRDGSGLQGGVSIPGGGLPRECRDQEEILRSPSGEIDWAGVASFSSVTHNDCDSIPGPVLRGRASLSTTT